MNRLLYLISGILFIIGGTRVINTKTYEFKYFTALELGDYSIIIGLFIISIGLILLYLYYISKQTIEFSKCKKCKKSYTYSDLKNGICPTCNIKTIETEEYYKKYPKELDNI